ncbi:hypothetical protein [Actinomadura algeriensis]|uniref:Secreted protein n=1 Tax=Actinomadura algeriensis TaxID=1679523 RepID=A0ABR9JQ89_9ACTN|nr:hypothetical protein [Actinomadura algeriensis]MBE1532589.1 hypothetical protein [Actinomadura algeriensis]
MTLTPPRDPPPAATAPAPAPSRALRTIPGRIRGQLALVLLAQAGLLAVLAVAVGDARDTVRMIGHEEGPQVVATGTLYFALSDMDAQVSNVLLIGRDHDLGIGRAESLRIYERRRAEADAAAVQAAQLAGGDPALRRTVQDVLNGLGRYERLVGRALQLSEQAGHPPGELPPDVIAAYRQATDLMKLEILPKAYNITLDSGARVRHSYETEHAAVLSGRAWLLLLGTVSLALLLALQFYLARTFRRVLNPALVLATLGTVALTAVGAALLTAHAGHMERAKTDGFDSILALSRARAVSHNAFADESRYLLDPGRADNYDQVYLDKSLSVVYPDMGDRPLNLENYYAALEDALASYKPGIGQDVPFLGFFGDEARTAEAGREAAALRRTLEAYLEVQRADEEIRRLAAEGDRAAAIDLRMDRRDGALRDFAAYDAALNELAAVHRDAFDRAVTAADGGLRGWSAVPAGAVAAIAVLAVAGVRPRLAEFR